MKTYLGDSVYVEWNGYAIVLTTENGYTDALQLFIQRLKGEQ